LNQEKSNEKMEKLRNEHLEEMKNRQRIQDEAQAAWQEKMAARDEGNRKALEDLQRKLDEMSSGGCVIS
jgi:hypothetical protein